MNWNQMESKSIICFLPLFAVPSPFGEEKMSLRVSAESIHPITTISISIDILFKSSISSKPPSLSSLSPIAITSSIPSYSTIQFIDSSVELKKNNTSPLPSLSTSQSVEPTISTETTKLTDQISSDIKVYIVSSHIVESSSNSSLLIVGTQVS